MTLGELCELTGMSKHALARELGEKIGLAEDTVIRKAYAREVPKHWLDALEVEESAGYETNGRGRDSELPPTPPPGARVESPPAPAPLADVDLGAVTGYIEGAYKLSAAAIRESDGLLADAIEAHAAQAGQAWARLIESEPKVLAFLQKMMVGTPRGEVIAVHVGIGFSYFLARQAFAKIEREQARAAAAAANGGESSAGPREPEPAFAGT